MTLKHRQLAKCQCASENAKHTMICNKMVHLWNTKVTYRQQYSYIMEVYLKLIKSVSPILTS